MTALEDRPQRGVFATLGPMYRSNDDKAWKAARKAGLIVHKVPGIGVGPAFDSVFVVCVEDKNGKLSNFRELFTAEEVIAEAQKAEHDTFELGDFFRNWSTAPTDPTEIAEAQERFFAYKVDVPCVSGNA